MTLKFFLTRGAGFTPVAMTGTHATGILLLAGAAYFLRFSRTGRIGDALLAAV
jgi:hypothetical protein